MRYAVVERVRERIGMHANMCCLTTVRKKETRVCVTQPTNLHSTSTERTDIRKQRLDSREAEQNATETPPTHVFVTNEVFERIVWVKGFQDGVVVPIRSQSISPTPYLSMNLLRKIIHTKPGIERQPQHDNRRKHHRQLTYPKRLEHKQHD
jgi:hypothetical protein